MSKAKVKIKVARMDGQFKKVEIIKPGTHDGFKMNLVKTEDGKEEWIYPQQIVDNHYMAKEVLRFNNFLDKNKGLIDSIDSEDCQIEVKIKDEFKDYV